MELKILIGKNKTGKTYEIIRLINENPENMFYLPSKEIKSKEINKKLFNFLNIKNYEYDVDDYENEIYLLLKTINNNIENIEDKTLVIDEVERFSHPELIEKIANTIFELSQKINVIVTTHSPIFLQRIFMRHINEIQTNKINKTSNKNHFVIYKYFYKKDNKYFNFELSKNKIWKMFDKFQNREISNLSRILFSENIFLLEGINDENIIYNFINSDDKYNNLFYSLIDCGSKSQILKMYNILCEFNLTSIMNICVFYDGDDDGILNKFKDKNYFEIVNYPNLEESLFERKNKDDFLLKNNKKISKQDIILKKEWILSNSTFKDIDKRLNYIYSNLEKAIEWMTKRNNI